MPLLVKIAPDLSDEDIDDVARLALDLKLDGIIATNTTIARAGLVSGPDKVEACGAGGLSGAPLKQRSLEVLRPAQDRRRSDLTLVSVGGVETAQDVQERLDAGATLVQGYTAFLYEGPFWAARINRELAKHPAGAETPHAEGSGSSMPKLPAALNCRGLSGERNQAGNSPRLTSGLGRRSRRNCRARMEPYQTVPRSTSPNFSARRFLSLPGQDEDVDEDRQEHHPEAAQDIDHLVAGGRGPGGDDHEDQGAEHQVFAQAEAGIHVVAGKALLRTLVAEAAGTSRHRCPWPARIFSRWSGLGARSAALEALRSSGTSGRLRAASWSCAWAWVRPCRAAPRAAPRRPAGQLVSCAVDASFLRPNTRQEYRPSAP